MKKLNVLASVLAGAAALALLFTGCNKEPVEEATLASIKLSGSYKTQFVAGDAFSTEGLVVKAKYSDDTTKTIKAAEYTAELAAANLDAEGKVKLSDAAADHKDTAAVTVKYEDKTASYNVTIVEAPTAIEVSNTDGITVEMGDTPDFSAVVVKAVYAEDDKVEVSGAKFEVDTSAAGEAEVTVTYVGKTTTFKITVTDLSVAISDTQIWWNKDGAFKFEIDKTTQSVTMEGAGACGAFLLNETVANGDKLVINYTASADFKIKPVAPDSEFVVKASDKQFVYDYTKRGKLTQLGVISSSDKETTVTLSRIILIKVDTNSILSEAITDAKAIYDAAVVGDGANQYKQDVKNALGTAIETAEAYVADTHTRVEYETAADALDAAVKTFKESVNTVDPSTLTNLVTSVTFAKAFMQPGWGTTVLANVTDIKETDGRVSISADNDVTYKLPEGLNATYQAQLFLNTDADLAVGDEWIFSCKITGVAGTVCIKLNDAEILIPMQSKAVTAEGTIISFSGTVPEDSAAEDIKLFMDFGTCSAGDCVISDIVISKTN